LLASVAGTMGWTAFFSSALVMIVSPGAAARAG
jgi:hypothetical protein